MKHYYKNIPGWFTFKQFYSKILEDLPDSAHIVEIGSWEGRSAIYMGVEILNSGKKIKFDCVDKWIGILPPTEHRKKVVYHKDALKSPNGSYNCFLKNIEPLKDVINPVRCSSLDAALLYKNESLDFVFIDADHSYKEVKKDILAWMPKIKNGGILSGHDYPFPDVKRAVDENVEDVIILKDEKVWYKKIIC